MAEAAPDVVKVSAEAAPDVVKVSKEVASEVVVDGVRKSAEEKTGIKNSE